MYICKKRRISKLYIQELRLKNFKQFGEETIVFNRERNILIGENGVGKTSILQAISYVINASESSIRDIGLQSLFNNKTISQFMEGKKEYQNLPILEVELFLSGDFKNFNINGIHNSKGKVLNGLKMMIMPNDEFSLEISESLKKSNVFPFDFYKLQFRTFSGKSYNSYNSYMRYALIDSTKVNTRHATRRFIEKVYKNRADSDNQQRIKHAFREHSEKFSERLSNEFQVNALSEEPYQIILDSKKENALEENLTIHKDGIDIWNMGQGDTVFINTDFVLSNASENTQIVLLEEPENHLSYLNMQKLIKKIKESRDKQTFISTHSNMISSRLDLSNAIFLANSKAIKLSSLTNDTADFFRKSPDNNVLNFILSDKAILVEGDAEYILLDAIYKKQNSNEMYDDNITLISCNGLTFKRYLEIAQLLSKKVAVITDNDKDYKKNIEENYSGFVSDRIEVFAPKDNEASTFEIALHKDNEEFLNKYLHKPQMINGVLAYMLNNKAEAAFRVLQQLESNDEIYEEFIIPTYINEAFEWIK